MSNFNQFVANSIAGFGKLSDPIILTETFNLTTSGAPFEYYKKPKRFQITGQISEVKLVGFSNVHEAAVQVRSDISAGTVTIEATIPNIRLVGQYKLAVAIEDDFSWIATGAWSLCGKRLSQAVMYVRNWKFGKSDDDKVTLRSHPPFQLQLLVLPQPSSQEAILGASAKARHVIEGAKLAVESHKAEFQCMFPDNEKGIGKISDNMKGTILRVLGEEVKAKVQPILATRIAERLRTHLMADINEVGFFEIMSGCVLPPPNRPARHRVAPVAATTNVNAHELPPAYSDVFETEDEPDHPPPAKAPPAPNPGVSARTSLPAQAQTPKERELTTSTSDISEVVLSSTTTNTQEGVLVKIVTEKTIFFKYK